MDVMKRIFSLSAKGKNINIWIKNHSKKDREFDHDYQNNFFFKILIKIIKIDKNLNSVAGKKF